MRKRTGFGWSGLLVGFLLIALGVFTFVRPDSMLTGAVVIYGILAILMGVEDIVVYARLARFTGFGPMLSLVTGILSVMCGVMLLANPGIGKGCFAQAWSVGEILRVYEAIDKNG